MPLDDTEAARPVWIGFSRRARVANGRYPQLATQVRCSSGFTHAPKGRLEALKPLEPRAKGRKRWTGRIASSER